MKGIYNITVLGIALAFSLVPLTIQAVPIRAKHLLVQNNAVYNALSQGLEKYKKGDYQRAVADFDRAIKLNPKNYDAYNKRGTALYELKEYQRAIADFSQAIKLNFNSDISYYNRGLILAEELNNNKAGIEDCNRAIQINPKYHIAYFKRGNSRFLLGDR